MTVLAHHIYEYKKGLRNLILHTAPASERHEVVRRLESAGISYLIYPLSNGGINVFFGHPTCIEVVRALDRAKLNRCTDEEDFILGIMLGYGRLMQCERYLARKRRRGEAPQPCARAGSAEAQGRVETCEVVG
jgi:hypothetical protein